MQSVPIKIPKTTSKTIKSVGDGVNIKAIERIKYWLEGYIFVAFKTKQ